MLASFSGKSGLADASEVIDLIDALTSVGARVSFAVVDVHVAHLAGPAGLANAPKKIFESMRFSNP